MTSSAEDVGALAQAENLALDIVGSARSTLMLSLRFLDVALWAMPFVPMQVDRPLGTDGRRLFVDPVRTVGQYRDAPDEIVRDLLHLILHCVFRHPIDDKHADDALWDIACDAAVESCALDLAGLRFPSSQDASRRRALEYLRKTCPKMTAEAIYSALSEAHGDAARAVSSGITPAFVESLAVLFARDSHSPWPRGTESGPTRKKVGGTSQIMADDSQMKLKSPASDVDPDKDDDPAPSLNIAGSPAPSTGGLAAEGDVEGGDRFMTVAAPREFDGLLMEDGPSGRPAYDELPEFEWQDIGPQVEADLEAFLGKPGVEPGTFSIDAAIDVKNRKRYDYREFLKRFATLSEEMKVSTEEFDYIYYTYGLTHYDNMPLVEPLEYQESRRVRDFVIAIDTSASCAGGLVRHFVEKTYDVLRSTSGFGRKINVHVLQCDCAVRKVTRITQLRDLDEGFAELQLRGFGGTDFRPVFEYVDELVARREFRNLKGMIYLTDGIGTYPAVPPDYECVFVFVNEEQRGRKVPPWATKVVMNEDEVYEL